MRVQTSFHASMELDERTRRRATYWAVVIEQEKAGLLRWGRGGQLDIGIRGPISLKSGGHLNSGPRESLYMSMRSLRGSACRMKYHQVNAGGSAATSSIFD